MPNVSLGPKLAGKSFGRLPATLKILRNRSKFEALVHQGEPTLPARSFEIRLIGPSGRVAEVYMTGGQGIACAITRAKILLQTHPEIAGAQIRYDQEIVPVDYETLH
jgi:hypothetical protein